MRAVTGTTSEELFQKRALFANNFVLRAEFRNLYDALSNTAYVNALMDRYSLQQITTPDPQNPDGTAKVSLTRADLINRLTGPPAQLTRAQVLRAIVESDEVAGLEFNRGFVAAQYFGYLRRDPEEAGFNAWLTLLNNNPNDFRTMVNGFLNSLEYRLRFNILDLNNQAPTVSACDESIRTATSRPSRATAAVARRASFRAARAARRHKPH